MLRNAAARGFLLAAALLAAAPARAVNCTGPNTYNVPAPFASITAALMAIPQTLPGPVCVTINDSGIYPEQVTVRNFINGGSSITIQAQAGQFPNVRPPFSSNAAFQIFNDSVNIQGVGVFVDQAMPYGVLVSSSFGSLSNVNVDGGASVSVAGIAISSWTTVSNSSVSLGGAHGLFVTGTGNTISLTTAVINSPNAYALYLNASTGNTITQSVFTNGGSTAAYFASGSNLNTISRSTMTGGSQAATFNGTPGLELSESSTNTIIDSVLNGGRGGSAVNQSPGGHGLYISGGSSNTVTRGIMSGGGGANGANGSGSGGGAGGINGGALSWGGNGLYLNATTSNTISQSLMAGGGGGNGASPPFLRGHGLFIDAGAFNAVSQSVMSGGGGGGGAPGGSGGGGGTFSQAGSGGTGAAGCCDGAPGGNGLRISTGSFANTVNVSFMYGGGGGARGNTANPGSGGAGLFITSSASNTVSNSFMTGGGGAVDTAGTGGGFSGGGFGGAGAGIAGAGGQGAFLESVSNFNVISLSTMTGGSGGAGGAAVHGHGAFLSRSSSNTISISFIGSVGNAVKISSGGFNAISGSSLVATGSTVSDYALHLVGASSNTVNASVISRAGPAGPKAVYVELESNGNSIVTSSITAPGNALTFDRTSSNTVVGSYVSGDSAVFVTGSTGTRVSGSSLNAAGGAGYGLRLLGGSSGLSVSASTVTAGNAGFGIYSNGFNGGAIEVLSTFVSGGSCLVCLETTTVGSTLWVASNTFIPGTSATGFQVLVLDGLLYGATIQNNNFYFRNAGMAGMGHRAMTLSNSRGLLIERNRINQPGTLGTGGFTGALFNNILNSSFHFNDVHSSGTMNMPSYMIDMTASTVSIRNNVFLSSMTGGGSTFVRADGNSGLPLDYNTYYSSNSSVQLEWNGLPYQFPWPASVGADRRSINGNPQWANTEAGGEDFHPKSTIGRFNPATQAFVTDTVDSPVLDYADPAAAFALEPAPNGGGANPGSYGNTIEASKSPASQCAVTRKVCKTGLCPFQTIQSAIDFLDNPLTAHSCVHLQDAGVYREYIRVEGIVNNGSSITIRLDPALTIRPYVIPNFGGGTAVFTIRNSSVNIANINIAAEVINPSYGIFASSGNVNVTSVTIADISGRFNSGGISMSSFSTLSYSSITVVSLNASALRLEGQASSVWFTTMSANASSGAALYMNDADSNTITRSFMSNAGGHGVHLLNGAGGNAISFSTMTSDANSYTGLYVVGSDSNGVTNSYMAGASGTGAMFNTGAKYNTISQSTMASNSGSGRALEISFSSWNAVTQSSLINMLGYAAYLNNANWNTISLSTITGVINNGFADGAAMRLITSSHNSITSDYIQGVVGHGFFADSFANANTITGSTIVAGASNTALFVRSSSSNTVTASNMIALTGQSAYFENNANYNAVSQSTISNDSSANAAFYISASGFNSIFGSSIFNTAGTGLRFAGIASSNTVTQSSLAGGASDRFALEIFASDGNTVTGSAISNPIGIAARLEFGADNNLISQSTITSAAASLPALHVSGSSTNTIQFSYIQGSSAALVSGSTGTIISMSSLVASAAGGSALTVQDGGAGLTVASSTLRGGSTGRGLRLDPDYSGVVSIGSVTITGAARGIELSTQSAGFALAVDSVTFRGLSAGATAIHFLGGLFSSTITLANFEDATTGANVSAAALGVTPVSIIRMRGHYGARTGPSFENDPNSMVHWQAGNFTGCAVTANVGVGQDFGTITAALAGLKANNNPLTGHSCVVVRDGTGFSEQVTIQGFTNNGSSLTIIGDPALSTRPSMSRDFSVMNASVNIVGIDLRPNVILNNGISVSSPNVTISSVNVIDPTGFFTGAGIVLSSWTTVSYTSVTVGNAYAYLLQGSTMSTISYSTAANNSTKAAVFFARASSNTLTGLAARNSSTGDALSIDYGGYNTVSQSSVSAGGSGIYLSFSTGNTISGTYIGGDGGHALRMENTFLNTIAQSTAVNTGGVAFAGLYMSGASTNTIAGLKASSAFSYGGILGNGSINNTVSFSTFNGNAGGQYGLYLTNNASSNTIDSSYVSNSGGTALRVETSSNTLNGVTIIGNNVSYGLDLFNASNNRMTIDALTGTRLDSSSNKNVITGSTLTKNDNTMYALNIISGSSNTVTQSRLSNSLSYALVMNGGGFTNYSTISQSTITGSGAGTLVLAGTGHGLSANYISNTNGYAVEAQGASYFSIALSTMTNNSAASAALYMTNSATNTVSQSVLVNAAGNAAFLENNSSWNTIRDSSVRGETNGIRAQSLSGFGVIRSTVTGGGGQGTAGVWGNTGIEYITVSQSYVQGSTAVYLNGSSRTIVNASVLVGGGGSGLYMSGGGTQLSMSSNTVLGGAASGIFIEQNVSGVIMLSTNTIHARTAPYTIGMAQLNAASSVWITSNTIVPALSASATTYGVYLLLTGGATVRNNGIYYRTAGAAFNGAGAGAYGVYAESVSGLQIDHNRISNPSMATAGNFIGAAIHNSPNAIFKFNDLHSTGAGLTTFNLLRITSSANLVVRNNILVSSMTATNNRMIVVDAASQAGFSSDYNTFFSSNSFYSGIWGTGAVSFLANWIGTTGRDANSLNANPRWLNPAAGFEDFHPLSREGRWNGTIFVQDAIDGPGLDRADPADPVVNEIAPNGARANQGSHGQTVEASKATLPCPTTLFVRQAGDGDAVTIQDGINALPNPLTSHSCIVIGDSGIYDQQVTVQGFTNNNSSITIMMDPALTTRPTVRQGFVIRNASVNVVNVDVAPTVLAISYGIFASSANVNITGSAVSDPGGFITVAGVAVSSRSTVSNANVSVQGAHGLRLDGSFAAVSNSTITNNSGGFNALYFAEADSNTVTGSVVRNLLGPAGMFAAGSEHNAISVSTIATPANARGLDFVAADYNTVTGSYIESVGNYGLHLGAGSDHNTISQSTMVTGSGANFGLYLLDADSNTVTGGYILNQSGPAAYLDVGSDYNTVAGSTLTSGAGGTAALFLAGASFNTLTGNRVSNPPGYGIRLIGGSNFNTLSFTTATVDNSGGAALFFSASLSNTVTGSHFSNPSGNAASLLASSNSNMIAFSTMTSASNSGEGLTISGSDFNVVTRSFISNTLNAAVTMILGSDSNTISFSTMTNNTSIPAVLLTGGSANSILNSYVQGSTAVVVTSGAGMKINASVLVATSTVGSGLALVGGSSSLTMSSNTVFGGSQGAGIYFDADNSGTNILSTNTIHGGTYGVYVATQLAGTRVWITSNTIVPVPSTTRITYGLYLRGLVTGATIQNNAIVYRAPGATAGGFYSAGLEAHSSNGLVIANNRISNPGLIAGSALGVGLTDAPNTVFKYNDVHSTGTSIVSAYHVRLNASPGVRLHNNVFSSSWSATASTSALFVDAASQVGFVSDYNDFFSSNSFNSIEWGAGVGLAFPWTATTGTDGSSINRHPRWKDPSSGVEDFHLLSQAGRWNGMAFVNDGYTSDLLDKGDPADGVGAEVAPHGFRSNLGSYGGTIEASKTPVFPTAPAIAAVFASSVSLSYGLVGADGYVVVASTLPNFLGTIFSSATSNPALATLSPQGLAANTTYFVFAGAVWGDFTVFANQVATATLANPPVAASPDFAAVEISSVTITWLPNGNLVDITTYSVVLTTAASYPNSFAGNHTFSTVPAGAAAFATRTGLAQNTTYYAFAAALNWNGVPSAYAALGSTSTLVDAPASAVTTFTAVNFSSFTVSWNANGNPLAVTSYTVTLSTAADFNAFASSVTFSTAPASGPTATFTGLSANELYYFQARAVNHDGIPSNYSLLGSTLTKPVSLQAPAVAGLPMVGVSSITAAWSLSALATGYQLVASLTNDSSAVFASSSPVGINATTATVFTPALSANTTYFLFVRALGPGAQTVYSAFGSTSTLAEVPLTAASTFTTVSVTSMTVAWLPNGNPVSVTSYTVVLSTGAAYPNSFTGNRIMSTAPAGAAPTASVGTLEDNTTYYLFVAAVNHNGITGAFIPLGSTITAIAQPAAVYFDEISSTTIVASAYAPTPLFSNLGAGESGTRIARNGAWQPFHGEAWAAATPMPAARHDAAVAGFNSKVYVFGGLDAAAPQSGARVYDPAVGAGVWTTLTAQPSARNGHAAAVAFGKIYVMGGVADGFTSLSLNEEYDPAADAWTAKAALGTASDRLSAVSVGEVVYAFGGETNGTANSKTAAYDALADAWTNKLDFPAARYQLAAAAAAGASGMTIVAAGGTAASNGNFAYDAAGNTWTAKTALPAAIEQGGAAALGGKIFVIGGAPARNTVYEFDPAANLWAARANMTTGRSGLGVAAAGGRVYAVGGTTDGGASSLTTVEEYDPGTATKFTGLIPNTLMGFKAQARNSVGTLSAETVVFTTYTLAALPAPVAAPFAVVEADSVTFSWALNGNPGATEFKARVSTSAAFGAGVTKISSDWGAMVSTAILTLTPNSTYFFESKARNGVAAVPGIETAWVPLGSTSTLAALPSAAPVPFETATNSLTVFWLANGNPVAVTSYTVVVTTENAYPNAHTGNVVLVATVPAAALPTATLSGLVANTTYFAFASAVNHNGVRTAYAALGSTSTLALAPAATAPAFSAVNQSSVAFSWLGNGNPVSVTTYSVVLTTSAIFPNANGTNVAFSTTPAGVPPTATATAGIAPNTTYYAYAAAVNWNGSVSAYTLLGSTATLAAAPATVVSTFTAVHVSSLTVSWSASGNPLAITTYTVQLSTAADFNAFATSFAFATSPVSGPTATFTGLADFTQYFFRVRAFNHGPVPIPTEWIALGSTTTLLAPLDAPTAPVFASVDVTSITATWGLTPGATGYTFTASLLPANPPVAVEATSTTFSINATTAAAFLPALASNTTYFLFVRANGFLRSSPYAALGSTSTLTHPPATVVSTFTGVGITSFTVSWDANGNALAITTYTVQLSTASDFNAFATSVTYTTAPANGPSAMLTGLTGNTSYYLRVRSFNHNGVSSAFVNLGSTLTVASPLFPTILDSQGGDAQWRRANGTAYQVAFLDTSGSHLDKFQVKASTTAGGLGTDLIDFTDVVVGLSPADEYNTPWALPNSVFNAMLEGVTNYVTVKVFNGPPLNNFTILQDAFFVQKDTTSPVIVNTQAGDAVPRSAGGTTYTVGVRDPSSGLAVFQYSASLNPGTANAAVIPWTDVAVVADATGYSTPWPVDFPQLISGVTNYISVRSWDVAGATTTLTDAFFVQKDTTGPSVAIVAPQNAGFHSALVTLSGTAASVVGVQGTEVSVLDVAAGLYWNPATPAFNSVTVVTMSATGTTAWTLSPAIAWEDGKTYRAVARSSTTAGLYSTTYATATFVMDLSKPAVGVLAPVPDSVTAVLPAISGTAADPAPNPSGVSSVEVRLRRNTDGFWWNWFTQAWSVTAVSSVTAGTTNWSLSPTNELKGNLVSGTSYFVAVRASDNALPANQGDFFVSGATFTWQDTTAPSAIADLAAAHGTAPGSMNLSWTASGDDGAAGFIAQGEYRVFYSTDIAAVPSTTTALVVLSTAGVSPGALQFHTLSGLTPGVTYFVAVALADGDYNWSLFSNQATTTAAPSPLNAITGHVVDISTQGITAVQIDAWNTSDVLVGTVFTLADGSGTFSVNNLPAGSYKLRVTYTVNGFSSSVWQDGIAMGSTNVDFVLEINYALATLTGTLSTLTTNAFGGGGLSAAAAVDSFIELHQQGRQVARVTVPPGGRWSISGLLPGAYSVRAHTALGYTAFQDVQLSEGEVRVLGFVFDPLPASSVFAFPNPARAATTIRFESALAPLQANIHVFDISGNLVKEFTDSQISRAAAPVYRADWDLRNQSGQPVAPGVYHVMVRIRGGSDDQSAKVIKKLAVVR